MAASAIDTEVSLLETLVETLDTCFELGEPCINPDTGAVVSDAEYDKLRSKLKQLNPSSHVFSEVTASLVYSGVKKVKHNPPMTSIDKAIGSLTERTDTLDKFIEDCKTNLGGDEVKLVQCYKRDGVAVSLYYENWIFSS